MNVILGNYGNGTIALIQWAKHQQLQDVTVVNVDTGWAAARWQQRIAAGQRLALSYGFQVETITSEPNFVDLMRQRKEFPSSKFQWCSSTLKGLALLDWLDDKDPGCEAKILVGKTRFSSRANRQLAEHIEESEFFDDRTLWHPLVHETEQSFHELITETGLSLLPHRSLECDPCINSTCFDLQQLRAEDLNKAQKLEQEVGKSFYPQGHIAQLAQEAKQQPPANNAHYLEAFDKGCSSPFACGE